MPGRLAGGAPWQGGGAATGCVDMTEVRLPSHPVTQSQSQVTSQSQIQSPSQTGHTSQPLNLLPPPLQNVKLQRFTRQHRLGAHAPRRELPLPHTPVGSAALDRRVHVIVQSTPGSIERRVPSGVTSCTCNCSAHPSLGNGQEESRTGGAGGGILISTF